MDIRLNFQVYDSRDPKEFIIIDTSKWQHLSDKTSIIEITLPGESKPVTRYYTKGVNVFNSEMLYLSCDDCGDSFEDLPDGIYTITIKASPDKFNKTRQYLRTTKTRLKLDELYIKSSDCFNSDEDSKNRIIRINEIDFLLKSAEANTRAGNNETAQNLFFRAQKILDKTSKCKTCK